MKIAVVAANGRSGQAFVTQALNNGHHIRGGYFGNNNLPRGANIEALKCDATSLQDVAKLISGCNAVVCLIGHTKNSPPEVQASAIANVVNAMDQLGIKRLVSLTGTGVRMAGDEVTLIDRILNRGVALVDPERVVDGKNHFEIIKSTSIPLRNAP